MPEKLHHLAFKLATLCSSGESSSNSRPENDNPKQQNANKMLLYIFKHRLKTINIMWPTKWPQLT